MRNKFYRMTVVVSLLAAAALFSTSGFPRGAVRGETAREEDPCEPVRKIQQEMRKGGVDPSTISCLPVAIDILWEFKETYQRHSPLGADTARLTLKERYKGYVMTSSDPERRSKIQSFAINGPSPCCPGNVFSVLYDVEARVLIDPQSTGRGVKRYATNEIVDFDVTPPSDNCFGIAWNGNDANAQVGFGSADVRLAREVVNRHRLRHGLDVFGGLDMRIRAYGPEAVTWKEFSDFYYRDGELTKVFTGSQGGALPGIPQAHTVEFKATVKLSLAEAYETWRVTVVGREEDRFQPPIEYIQGGVKKVLPVGMDFDWRLEGEIKIRRYKKSLFYDSGRVLTADLTPQLCFSGQELYRCDFTDCGNAQLDELRDWPILGRLQGRSLKLTWPGKDRDISHCLTCMPRKSYLSPAGYRAKFGSQMFIDVISRQNLELKDGASVSGNWHDWLTYTITLKKIS